ncbi:hypothetical protein GN956_G9519 [Arapaima gigas]
MHHLSPLLLSLSATAIVLLLCCSAVGGSDVYEDTPTADYENYTFEYYYSDNFSVNYDEFEVIGSTAHKVDGMGSESRSNEALGSVLLRAPLILSLAGYRLIQML